MSLVIGATGAPELPTISTMSDEMAALANSNSLLAGSATYPTASQAIFVPFVLSQARTYAKAWWMNGAAVAGNVDVGIYTLSGTTLTRVVASTAEAQATVSVVQVATTFTTTTVGPGTYYLALSTTSASSTFWRVGVPNVTMRATGIFVAAASSPLPPTATAALGAGSYVPIFGLSELATV